MNFKVNTKLKPSLKMPMRVGRIKKKKKKKKNAERRI